MLDLRVKINNKIRRGWVSLAWWVARQSMGNEEMRFDAFMIKI